jgi:hypothetical protein
VLQPDVCELCLDTERYLDLEPRPSLERERERERDLPLSLAGDHESLRSILLPGRE